jgi:hypothetical protein
MTATDPTNIPGPDEPQGPAPSPMSADRIETAEELDALPVGSVVLDPHRMAWQKRQGLAVEWFAAGVMGGFSRMATPATVLHRPDRPSDLGPEEHA